ncbi:hypothetical protein SAMN05444008_101262 [Cnuella takakiae]|uniref:Uncharacterized protein n=1 Tax=Cnuella takakiae TaxID=1302690 RepID=A0A1M4SX70_9BACT|nr:hypothetical protein SAMN05444008_101262 [Cnuella takakiae]
MCELRNSLAKQANSKNLHITLNFSLQDRKPDKLMLSSIANT